MVRKTWDVLAVGIVIGTSATIAITAPAHAMDVAKVDTVIVDASDGAPITEPMTVIGFDEEVAEENGREIVVLPDGKRASVPQHYTDAVEDGEYRVLGQDTEYGNCGWSFVELYNVGGKTNNAELRSGWHVNDRAVEHVWTQGWNPPGPTGNQYRAWAGGIPLRNDWNTGIFHRTFGGGIGTSWVNGDLSWVITWKGTICGSLGPWTSAAF